MARLDGPVEREEAELPLEDAAAHIEDRGKKMATRVKTFESID